MFSNTAYEALYQYLGLELHAKFIEILTSHKIFMATVLVVFGVMFFVTSVQFFSRYIPGTLVRRKFIPLSKYFKIILCLFIGMSLLKVGATAAVKRFNGESWNENPYVIAKAADLRPHYRVSFIFSLLSGTAEGVAAFLTKTVDKLFSSSHSQLEAPSFFYKSVLYAGSATIADKSLRSVIDFYTEECLIRALALLSEDEGFSTLDRAFSDYGRIDSLLQGLSVQIPGRPGTTCLDVKNEVREDLIRYTRESAGSFPATIASYWGAGAMYNETVWENIQMSMALTDYYLESRESFAGIQKGSQPPEGTARIYQYINRFFSWDMLSGVLGGKEDHGSALAAKRAQEFSENLTRAPHVAGFIKLILVAIFPWLIFPVVAGYWRVLVFWFLLYASVLLWAPLWTLMYHLVVNITLSAETLAAFGRLGDGISLYSANIVTSRLNYMYAVYSWIQLIVAVGVSGGVLWFARPSLSDSQASEAPDFVEGTEKAASVSTAATGQVGRML